jgi:glutathione S-transferase
MRLLVYQPAFGEPSASPFCVKAMCLMQMAGAEYRPDFGGDPRKAPKGKLPVLVVQGRDIPDSAAIQDYLEEAQGIDFDAGLSDQQRAVSRAVIRMIEEHLYFAGVASRWLDDAGWGAVRAELFAVIPALARKPLSSVFRRKVRAQLLAQGMARHSEAEQLERADRDLAALAVLLDGKPFLFGDAPSAADATAGPFLAAMAAAPVANGLSTRIGNDAALMGYVERVRAAIYPKG